MVADMEQAEHSHRWVYINQEIREDVKLLKEKGSTRVCCYAILSHDRSRCRRIIHITYDENLKSILSTKDQLKNEDVCRLMSMMLCPIHRGVLAYNPNKFQEMFVCEMEDEEQSEMQGRGVQEISDEGRTPNRDNFLDHVMETLYHEGDSRKDLLDNNDVLHTDTIDKKSISDTIAYKPNESEEPLSAGDRASGDRSSGFMTTAAPSPTSKPASKVVIESSILPSSLSSSKEPAVLLSEDKKNNEFGSRESFDPEKWDGKKFLLEAPLTLNALPSRRRVSSHSFIPVSLQADESRNSGPPPKEDDKIPSLFMRKSTRHRSLSEQATLNADVKNLSFPRPHVTGTNDLKTPIRSSQLFVTEKPNDFTLKATSHWPSLIRKESLFEFTANASDPSMTELHAKHGATRHTFPNRKAHSRSPRPEIILPIDVSVDLASEVSESTGESMNSDCPAEALENLNLANESREDPRRTRKDPIDFRGLFKLGESGPLQSRPISSPKEDIPDIDLSSTVDIPEVPKDSSSFYRDDAKINRNYARLRTKPAGQVHGPDWIDWGVSDILKKDIKLEYVYVLFTTDEKRHGCVKVGMTTDIRERVKRVSNCCRLPDLEEARHWEAVPFAKRVEQLVFAELRNFQRLFVCEKVKNKQSKGNKIHHKEWFDVPTEVAIQSVKRWAAFVRSEPYDEDGRLIQFWARWAKVLPKASEDEVTSLQTDVQQHHRLRHERYQNWLDRGIQKAKKQRKDEIAELLNDEQS